MKLWPIALALTSCVAQAGTMGLHLASWHDSSGFNGVNPGLYYRFDNGVTLGGYRNSLSQPSFYAGYTLGDRFALTGGVITGYPDTKLLLAPSIRITEHARVAIIPRVAYTPLTIHLSYEWKLR